ncbi:MAG: hypothetical protein AB1489_13150 [Acidobacteriota bacterium]
MATIKNRIVVWTVLLFGLLPISSRQTMGQEADLPRPLEIKEIRLSFVSKTPTSAEESIMPHTSRPGSLTMPDSNKDDDKQLFLGFKLKNISAKQSAVIYWELRFTDIEQQLVSKQFKSKKKIKPGQEETIEEAVNCDMSRVPDSIRIGFRVIKIVYSDDSVWDYCIKDSDACFVYNNYRLKDLRAQPLRMLPN